MRILVIDPQFDHEPDVERAVAGPDTDLVFARTTYGAPVDDDLYRDCDALINVRSQHQVTARTVELMQRCRIVVQAGVGYNHIDLAACAARGIPVCNTPDYGTMEVADHAVALVLALARGIPAYDAGLRRVGGWDARRLPDIRRLRDLRLGVLGLGRIGLAAARRLATFGFEMGFYDPHQPPGFELAVGFKRFASLGELLDRSDVLTIHAPLTAETEGMIDAEALARLPKGAILVNTARGPIVNLDAVAGALRVGHLGAAGLDVLPVEPPDYEHPLLAAWRAGEDWLENRLLVTPHAAFYSDGSLIDIRRLSMITAMEFLKDGKLRACVNGHLLPK
jgi:phosphoglycerate dehydrogenase-like enzyme